MLRSLDSTDRSYIRFENKTKKCIEIIWVDYKGVMVKYGTLCPEQYLAIDTFKTHPWMFIDPITGEKMLVGSKTVFYPPSIREVKERFGRDLRIPVLIHLPLFTLRRISLHAVLSCLNNIDDVDRLGLPNELQRDLKKLNQDKEKLLAQVSFSFQGCHFFFILEKVSRHIWYSCVNRCFLRSCFTSFS